MKKITIFGGVVMALTFYSCGKKVDVEPTLNKTKWISEDGTQTLEFTKKEVLLNDVSIYDGKGTVYVEDGQIWAEDGDEMTYMFDYKISGENLFVATETTSAWDDPSSPAVVSEKYKEE